MEAAREIAAHCGTSPSVLLIEKREAVKPPENFAYGIARIATLPNARHSNRATHKLGAREFGNYKK